MFIWGSEKDDRFASPAYMVMNQVGEEIKVQGIYANEEEAIMQLSQKANNPAIIELVVLLFENTEKDGHYGIVGLAKMDDDGGFSDAENYLDYKESDFVPMFEEEFCKVYHENKK